MASIFKFLSIKDLKENDVNKYFSIKGLLQKIELKKDMYSMKYYHLTFCDKYDTIFVRLYEGNPLFTSILNKDIGTTVYEVTGIAEKIVYNGSQQKKIYIVSGIHEIEDLLWIDYAPYSKIGDNNIYSRFRNLIDKIENPNISILVKSIFNKYKYFFTAPAAKTIHHNYRGGLLEHSVNVTSIALNAANYYSKINTDYIIAGGLLHDIGKTKCYKLGKPIEVTINTIIFDHIIIGYSIVREEMDREENICLTNEDKDNILHIILSHHGSKEKGSPVIPITPEAIIVSSSDALDANAKASLQAISEINTGNLTEYNKVFKTQLWNGKY